MQLLENWIKNIHIFLKKHFFYFFLNPPLQNIWRHFLSSFCVCICKSFLLFYMFFCTRIYHLKQASQALVNITDMFSFRLILRNRTSGIFKTKFILCICLCILTYFFLSFVCSFFFYQNFTDINIFLTPQIGSHGHKKTPDCYTKGHSKVKNHVSIFFFFDWNICLKSTVDFCRLSRVYYSSSTVE